MIGLLTMLGRGRRFPGLANVVHTRTTVGSEQVTVPTYYQFADLYAIGAGGLAANGFAGGGGGGGGGGGYAKVIGIPVTPGDTFTLTVNDSGLGFASVEEDATGAVVQGNGGNNAVNSAEGAGGGFTTSGTFSGGVSPVTSLGANGVTGIPTAGGGAGGTGGSSGAVVLGDNTLIPSAPGAPGVGSSQPGGNATGVGCGGGGGSATAGVRGTSGSSACIVVFRTK